MNPYLQYFIGLSAFTQKSPFDSSMETSFRKNDSHENSAGSQRHHYRIGRPSKQEDDDDAHGESGGSVGNKGTLILDATCALQNIRFPTDASLLNEARLNAGEIIDVLHENGLIYGKKKHRTYREKRSSSTTVSQRAGKRA